MNQNFEQFKKDFKRDLLVRVVVNMKHGRINRKEGGVLARKILELMRTEDASLAFRSLNKLSETHPEILDIFIKRGYEFDEREKVEKQNLIIVYLKNGGDLN